MGKRSEIYHVGILLHPVLKDYISPQTTFFVIGVWTTITIESFLNHPSTFSNEVKK